MQGPHQGFDVPSAAPDRGRTIGRATYKLPKTIAAMNRSAAQARSTES